MWQLARNTLAGRPWRTLLMIGAVMIAASLVVAMTSAIGSAQASMVDGLQRLLGASDARIIHPGNGRFDAGVLDQVRAWPQVKLATGRVVGSLTLVHADHRRHPETAQLLRLTPAAVGVDLQIENLIRDTNVVEGAWPKQPNEILLDRPTADQLHARVGDALEVQRFGEPVPLVVSGIFEQVRLPALQRPLVKLDRHTLANATDRPDELTAIAIVLAEGADVAAFCDRHANELPAPLELEPAEMVRSGLNRQVRANNFGFTIGSIFVFICASFIIVTALTTSVTERQREMAVIRCIGASRRQLFAAQLLAGFVLALVGAGLGIPLGIALAALLVALFEEFLSAGLQVQRLGVALAVAGSVGAGLLGALYPAFMASRVPPLQALSARGRPPRKSALIMTSVIGFGLIGLQLSLMTITDPEHDFLSYAYVGLPSALMGYFLLAVPLAILVTILTAPLLSSALKLPGGMLARSILGTPYRNGFTAGAMMVGIAILVTTWSSMTSLLQDWIGKTRFADGFVVRTTGILPKEQHAIAELPFVRGTCAIGYLPVRVVGRQIFGVQGLAPPNVTCVGFEPDVFFAMNAIEWSAGSPTAAIPRLKAGDGVIVADRFLTTQRVKLGDSLTLASGRTEREFTIVGAVNSAWLEIATQLFGIRNQYLDFSVSCVFMDWNVVGDVFGNRDAYIMQVSLAPQVSDEEVGRRISDAVPGVQFTSGRWIIETVNAIAAGLLAVQSAIAFAALVLASLGVGNVVLANIHGRRYEYGVLRAVGAPTHMLARLVFAEAVVLAITAALVGTLLGLHLSAVAATHYRHLAGLPVRVTFPVIPTAIGWAVVIALTLLAAVPGVLSIVRPRPAALLAAGRAG